MAVAKNKAVYFLKKWGDPPLNPYGKSPPMGQSYLALFYPNDLFHRESLFDFRWVIVAGHCHNSLPCEGLKDRKGSQITCVKDQVHIFEKDLYHPCEGRSGPFEMGI